MPMKFFVPRTKPAKYQGAYENMAALLKDQLKATIGTERIYSLNYHQDKKDWRLQVGELEPRENRYEVLAIFESRPYIVFTRSRTSNAGTTILIDASDVTKVEYFDVKE